MKDSAIASEIADPYAALETIVKIVGRSWLSEEWRLEDIRLLAQEAIAARSGTASGKFPGTAAPSLQPRIETGTSSRRPVRRGERVPS